MNFISVTKQNIQINMGWWDTCYKKVSAKSSIVCQIISKIMAILTFFLASLLVWLHKHSIFLERIWENKNLQDVSSWKSFKH